MFISDHGEMNGRRAMVDKGVYLYPDVVRVPMVFKLPANMPREHATVESPASLLDLSQTILDFAGIKPEAKFDGISLLPRCDRARALKSAPCCFSADGMWASISIAASSTAPRMGAAIFTPTTARRRWTSSSISTARTRESDRASPEHAKVRKELIQSLGAALQADPRWAGYWAEFRIARFRRPAAGRKATCSSLHARLRHLGSILISNQNGSTHGRY